MATIEVATAAAIGTAPVSSSERAIHLRRPLLAQLWLTNASTSSTVIDLACSFALSSSDSLSGLVSKAHRQRARASLTRTPRRTERGGWSSALAAMYCEITLACATPVCFGSEKIVAPGSMASTEMEPDDVAIC